MKLLVITGSSHKNGSSSLLTEAFYRSTKKVGHQVEILGATCAKFHPCMGCDTCEISGL